ncbi:MAG: large extracellular alpha-helical protein, partial [Proteobacteria bacterium]|nr:large extracellular alpha-helical protein [Pseudomonadota bacterium]
EPVETKLHEYLSALLKKDVLPTFYSRGMSSTVRAVALAALAEQGLINLSDLERYQTHVPYMSLFGKAHYLQAALKLNGAQSIVKDVTRQILAHSSQTGGKFLFNETSDTDYKRILATPLRANAAILSAFTRLGETDYGKDIVGDIPFKIVRAMSQARQSRPHWDNTQENIFCLNALVDYSRIYETLKPDMTVKTFMDNRLMGQAKFKDLKNDPVHFIRPVTAADPGKNAQVSIQKKGDGRLYYETRLSFAPMDARANRINAGIDIRKEYSVERDGNWILLTDPMQIKRGELVRVDIFLSLPAARHFVVVDDPVPGGLEPVNAQLATASVLDAQKADFNPAKTSWWFKFSDWLSYGISRWSFYHQELGHDAVRFYSDYLGPGNYHLSYTAQAIASGRFLEMPVHAQEMYEPDVFGKGLPAQLHISDEN